MLLLSKDDAEKLIAGYDARRGPIVVDGELGPDAKGDRYGYFYLIQLVPEALPNRVKIGFADSGPVRDRGTMRLWIASHATVPSLF